MSETSATTSMLIHQPPADVFEAFANPRSIVKFWLKSASGPLAKDAVVRWEFLVEGASETVTVKEFIPHQLIAFTWSDGILVRMTFEPTGARSTVFSVTATGFQGEDVASQAINATEGFTIVACDLKALLETGHSGRMVRDKAALIEAART